MLSKTKNEKRTATSKGPIKDTFCTNSNSSHHNPKMLQQQQVQKFIITSKAAYQTKLDSLSPEQIKSSHHQNNTQKVNKNLTIQNEKRDSSLIASAKNSLTSNDRSGAINIRTKVQNNSQPQESPFTDSKYARKQVVTESDSQQLLNHHNVKQRLTSENFKNGDPPCFQPNLNLSYEEDENPVVGSPTSSFRKSLMERRKPVHQ